MTQLPERPEGAKPAPPKTTDMTGGKFVVWLALLPTTNFRIFVSICLAVVFVLTVIGGIVARLFFGSGDYFDPDLLWPLVVFLLSMMGIDAVQYIAKRVTYKPSPPLPSDVEDTA